ncbi:p20 [Pseudomonas phage PaP2]|uniref:Uncharacterized protein n=1 Tax=Pseudomonas phage PaMx41 TaxID=1815976 RepID=A0A1C8HTF7_BPPP4|nr:hypothetical protein KNT55_gp20 [Pseudomonas phage PaMx41]YP_024748.1 hypothetical protein PaP2_gp20 [Pseudomonas phage PaP2]ANA48872.1 hypothetical protein PaMx33_ORF19 [Pseudomonas phage PaMx33]ANA49037.1 hypothetical protein PaMx43_ORF19 [Pseudomonas phage PaMx43]ANA49091.1 hypothetical protein PaMx46_ORF19 [Pseudomonas phage PaMx46]QBP37261.1 hypothetical protein TF_20 [Pseudomonas phage vB_PaeP_TF17]HCI2654941.1 hypothetical protein [Pseudomonas aeruginosa]
MATSVPNNAMILASEAGRYIPVDVVRPKYQKLLNPGAELTTFELPEEVNFCLVIPSVDMLLVADSQNVINPGGWTNFGYAMKADREYKFILPKKIMLQGSGSCQFNICEKWSTLQQEGKYTTS